MNEKDELAMAAMQALLSTGAFIIWRDAGVLTGRVAEGLHTERMADLAYEMASAMIKARGPKKELPMPSYGAGECIAKSSLRGSPRGKI